MNKSIPFIKQKYPGIMSIRRQKVCTLKTIKLIEDIEIQAANRWTACVSMSEVVWNYLHHPKWCMPLLESLPVTMIFFTEIQETILKFAQSYKRISTAETIRKENHVECMAHPCVKPHMAVIATAVWYRQDRDSEISASTCGQIILNEGLQHTEHHVLLSYSY